MGQEIVVQIHLAENWSHWQALWSHNFQVLFGVGNLLIVCMTISHSDRTVPHAVSYNLLTIFAWRSVVGQSFSSLQALWKKLFWFPIVLLFPFFLHWKLAPLFNLTVLLNGIPNNHFNLLV